MSHICNTLPELNATRTQSLRDRVLEASAELVEVGAAEGPPLLPLVAEAAETHMQIFYDSILRMLEERKFATL